MRLNYWTNHLLSHRYKALAMTFLISFIPMLGVLGVMFATLVTIRRGALEGAILTVAATLPYCFLRIFVPGGEAVSPTFIWMTISVGVISNALTWAFAVMMRRGATWSSLLQTAALLGVLVISVVHLAYPNVADWWAGQLQFLNAQVQDSMNLKKSLDPESLKEAQIRAINAAKLVATGAVVGMTLFIAVFQLILACWWNAVVFSRGSLQRGLHQIRLSRLAGVLFIASLVFSYWDNSVVLDIMPVLYLLFGAAGLSLLHYFFEMMKGPVVWFWLFLMYATLILAVPASIAVVATVALLDVWLDLRKRFRKV